MDYIACSYQNLKTVEVTDLEAAKVRIAPVLESQGYDYFWRPTSGQDGPPFYPWFIKRDPRTGARTHHIQMVVAGLEFQGHWERLLFRDYLIEHPEVAEDYERLKVRLASTWSQDRIAYTRGKTEFIDRVTERAKRHFCGKARILALGEAWKAAAARRDLDGMLAIYASDAQELLSGMPPIVGGDAIRGFYRGLMEEFPRFAHEFHAGEVIVAESGDLAFVRGWYRFASDERRAGQAQTGKFVGVWRHLAGDWRLQINISSSDHVPPSERG